MINPHAAGAPAEARRSLRREEMVTFGADLDWLIDPTLIPASATEFTPPRTNDPCEALAGWMLDQVVDWSGRFHYELNYAGTFDKHKLDPVDRIVIRDTIRKQTWGAYAPGIMATSQVFEVTPHVAAREGITDPARWAEIALEGKNFASAYARSGTDVQALVRSYLADGKGIFNTTKFELSGSGITTITPVEKLVSMAKEVTTLYIPGANTANICTAMQAPMVGSANKQTMYDAFWDAFRTAAETHIYPSVVPETPKEPHQDSEDEIYAKMRETIEEFLRRDVAALLECDDFDMAQVLGALGITGVDLTQFKS